MSSFHILSHQEDFFYNIMAIKTAQAVPPLSESLLLHLQQKIMLLLTQNQRFNCKTLTLQLQKKIRLYVV